MLYNDFKDKSLSRLGFGLMRLPLNEDKTINKEETFKMVDYAMNHGINYYDTAYPYHDGDSELVIGEALKRYDRESFYLATKYPGHQTDTSYNPQEIFEDQLKKCQVDYFDFYLLHNVCEKSIDTYLDERWNIIPYFIEMRKQGKIKHLGFSTHAGIDCLKDFLNKWGDEMEFCQIQFNYLDYTLQKAKEKLDILDKCNIPVWVMEPLRGGKLANLDENLAKKLDGRAPAAEALRFIASFPNIKVILSGMSSYDQMVDNVSTFENYVPMEKEEADVLFEIAEQLKAGVPCTACRYCVNNCPMGLDIPALLNAYNDIAVNKSAFTPAMFLQALPEDKRPTACVGCGACAAACPQKIDIPAAMQSMAELMPQLPNWDDICKDRNAKAREKMLARQEKSK